MATSNSTSIRESLNMVELDLSIIQRLARTIFEVDGIQGAADIASGIEALATRARLAADEARNGLIRQQKRPSQKR